MNGYEFKNATAQIATILVYDVIGQDFFSEESLTAKSFADELDAIGKVKEINVRINSPGGSIFDARGMANLLKAHPAKKIVDIDGLCASAATYIACAGDVVRMAFDGTYMIHPPMNIVMGTSLDMLKAAETLDKIEESILATYVDFTGQKASDVKAWMDAETWMTGEEAKQRGFVGELTGRKSDAPPVDLSKLPFANTPERLVNHEARDPLKLINENGRLRIRFLHGQQRLDRAKNAVEAMRMKIENASIRGK